MRRSYRSLNGSDDRWFRFNTDSTATIMLFRTLPTRDHFRLKGVGVGDISFSVFSTTVRAASQTAVSRKET